MVVPQKNGRKPLTTVPPTNSAISLHRKTLQPGIDCIVFCDVPISEAVFDQIPCLESADCVAVITVRLCHAEVLLAAGVDCVMHVCPRRRVDTKLQCACVDLRGAG